jgi:multidrug efflux pump subunit AcrB
VSHEIYRDTGSTASQWRQWRTAKANARAAEAYARALRPWFCHPLLVIIVLLIIVVVIVNQTGAVDAFWDGYNGRPLQPSTPA